MMTIYRIHTLWGGLLGITISQSNHRYTFPCELKGATIFCSQNLPGKDLGILSSFIWKTWGCECKARTSPVLKYKQQLLQRCSRKKRCSEKGQKGCMETLLHQIHCALGEPHAKRDFQVSHSLELGTLRLMVWIAWEKLPGKWRSTCSYSKSCKKNRGPDFRGGASCRVAGALVLEIQPCISLCARSAC